MVRATQDQRRDVQPEEVQMRKADVLEIIQKQRAREGELISILEEIQARFGFLPADALRLVAEQNGRSLVDVFGVATFYRAFSLEPRGKHLCSVCLGTACHVRGAPSVSDEFERQLGVRSGETTVDREFTLETVNCLGACALGPIVVVDGHYFSNVGKARVKDIVERTRRGLDTIEVNGDRRIFPVDVSCARCNHSLMDPRNLVDGYPSIRVTISFGQEHGWLRLSGLYGSNAVEAEHEVPMDSLVQFFCPHCHAELIGASKCAECRAPMVPMIIRGGGIVQICSRRGCKGHLLDLGESIVG